MSYELLRKHKPFIKLLCETKSDEQRQALLDTATPSQVRAISELCLNLLHERGCDIPAGPEREKLVENQVFVRKLATEERPFALKRNLLANTHQREGSQTGDGIFSFLVPILGGLAKTLLGGSSGK